MTLANPHLKNNRERRVLVNTFGIKGDTIPRAFPENVLEFLSSLILFQVSTLHFTH
jgi:hypothetical protein